jgi:tetratricopeptide (TPR) repeat protein
MKKPRKHIVQTISNKAFANIVPDEWAARELDQDYGLDFMLEIFEDEYSTGKILFVQLKGTDDEPENDSITYQIKRTHLEYYSSIPTPILFVIYSVPSKAFWAVWSNNLESFLEKKKDDQKSNLLRLTKDQIIDDSYFKDLPAYFTQDLPDKVTISSNADSDISKYYNAKLIDWLKHYFQETIVADSSLLNQKISLDYQTTNSKDLEVNIKFSLSSSTIEIDSVATNKSLLLPITNFKMLDKIFVKPLVQLSIALLDYNVDGSTTLLIKCIEADSTIEFSPENTLSIGTKLVSKGNIKLLQKFIEAIIEIENYSEFQLLNFIILSAKDENSVKYYQSNLEKVISQVDDGNFKGVLCYNLANSYRGSDEFYLASRHYQYARKFEPKYLTKPYWWYEYAGVMFLTKHYKVAEQFYKKSEKLGGEKLHGRLLWALTGDCLFYQCKFTEANVYFKKYMEAQDDVPDEFFLKYDVCRNMILAGFDEVKPNIQTSNELIDKAEKERSIDLLGEAIEKNPLNALAWFNYGVSLDQQEQPKQAFMAYLTACSIAEWDIEAWKNCFLISWNLRSIEKLMVFYKIILRRFGLESVNYLADHILDDPHIEQEVKLGIIDAFKQVAEELNKST